MSADARTAHTDAGDTLGTIISSKEQRDAIHLAVEPMQAQSELEPGEYVKLVNGKAYMSYHGDPDCIGIVDPFLGEPVYKGQWFWLVLLPRTIRSLRHVWEHPAFPTALPVAESKQEVDPRKVRQTLALIGDPQALAELEIERVALQLGVEESELLEHARDHIETGEYWNEGGRFDGEHIPESFWPAYEQVTGTTVPDDDKGSFLTCSC